jgi:hypothetical protein
MIPGHQRIACPAYPVFDSFVVYLINIELKTIRTEPGSRFLYEYM